MGVFVRAGASAAAEASGCGISVMEYSEMDAADANARDESGELEYKVCCPHTLLRVHIHTERESSHKASVATMTR